MPLPERKELYAKIEQHRGCPLVAYVTSTRGGGATGRMASDAIAELLDQIEKLPPKTKKIDLLVVSNGGDPTVAWRAISLLRERDMKIGLLIPQVAFSAATLLALGADEIVMHPNGNLGPVDPQITVTKPTGEQRFGYEEMTAFLQFCREEVGLTDQEHIRQLFDLFCKEVGTVPVGVAARSSLLSLSMGEKLLRQHMIGEENVQKARNIAESLNKSYFHHGYPVGRREAQQMGLKIAKPDEQIEGLIWQVWQDIEKDLKIREPFNPIFELMASDQGAKLVGQVAQPKGTVVVPGVHQQLIQNVHIVGKDGAALPVPTATMLKAIIDSGSVMIDPVDYEYTSAIMESTRVASRHSTRGKIMAFRAPDLNFQIHLVPAKMCWEPCA